MSEKKPRKYTFEKFEKYTLKSFPSTLYVIIFWLKIKEWLTLAFFPQEDRNELNQLRGQLTPFLKAVTNALSAELEIGLFLRMIYSKQPILDEVIQNIPPENSHSITIGPSTRTIDTLNLEFNEISRR